MVRSQSLSGFINKDKETFYRLHCDTSPLFSANFTRRGPYVSACPGPLKYFSGLGVPFNAKLSSEATSSAILKH